MRPGPPPTDASDSGWFGIVRCDGLRITHARNAVTAKFVTMASDLQYKTVNRMVRLTQTLTGGRVGWNLRGMAVVELTTTGRKSGLPRTVMLTSPWQEGTTIVLVASRGGDDKAPAWLHNIEATPGVQVVFKNGPLTTMSARVASPEERGRLWPLLTAEHPHYAGYQRKTEREIPLVLLEPVGTEAP